MAIFILMPMPAECGCYKLLKNYPTGIHEQMWEVGENDMDVCKAYEKNLNSFPKNKLPMVCDRPINPTFKDFRELQWTDLNVSERKDMIQKMDKESLYYKGNPNAFKIEEWEKQFKSRVSEGRIKLRLAKIEVTKVDSKSLNDLTYILEYDTGRKCNPMKRGSLEYSGGYNYFITDNQMKKIIKILGDASIDKLSGPFVYNNCIYFTSFSYRLLGDLKSRQYEVWLHKLVRPLGEFAAVPVCRFKYTGNVPVDPKLDN